MFKTHILSPMIYIFHSNVPLNLCHGNWRDIICHILLQSFSLNFKMIFNEVSIKRLFWPVHATELLHMCVKNIFELCYHIFEELSFIFYCL